MMSDLFHIGSPGKSCSLPLRNYIGRTIELIPLHVPQRLVPSCFGSSIGAEPSRMVSKRVGASPALHMGVDPTYCLSRGLFGHTHTHDRGLLVGSI